MAAGANRIPFGALAASAAGYRLGGGQRVARMNVAGIETDEDELLAGIAAGEAAAFARLMERHLDRAHALALRLTGNRADAEDVAQEAFLRVWRKAGDWQPGRARFSTWLYRVVMNLCLDGRRRSVELPVESWTDAAEPGPNAEAMLLAAERDARLLGALAELPARQRQAMALCYTLGLSNGEAAEAMAISLKAYEALLARAKRTIRASMEENS